MTKKHFEAFAKAINNWDGLAIALPKHKELIEAKRHACFTLVCLVAAQTNAKFDKERFKKACGL